MRVASSQKATWPSISPTCVPTTAGAVQRISPSGLPSGRAAKQTTPRSGTRCRIASPLAIADLRDGGWHGPAGLAAAAAFVAWRWLGRPALRRPIAAGALVSALAWFGGSAALGRWDRPPAPDVTLTVLEGGTATTLAQAIAGRPAVVNLWASWCGPCREEMPALEAVQRARPDVAVLRVNQGETEAVVRAWLARDRRVAQGVLLDPGWRLGKAIGAAGLPTTLFFDASGRRVDAHFGVLTEAALHARLAALGTPQR